MGMIEEAKTGIVAGIIALILGTIVCAILQPIIFAITGIDILAIPPVTIDQAISMSP